MPRRNRRGQFVRARRHTRRARHNPPKRHRRHRRPSSRTVIQVYRPRRARRNPPRSRPGTKGYKTPAATRAKISAAVKRAMAARRAGGGSRAVSVRRSSSPSRRRSYRQRLSGGLSYGRSEFRRLLSSATIQVAGGAVGAGFVTSLVINKFGAHLPMIDQPIGRIGYRLAIPTLGALAVRRYNRNVADGMLIGGMVSAINEGIRIMSGSPSVVPVATSRPMASNAGIIGSGGKGSFSGYAGEDGYDEYLDSYLDYAGGDDEFSEYDDQFAEAGDEFAEEPFVGSEW